MTKGKRDYGETNEIDCDEGYLSGQVDRVKRLHDLGDRICSVEAFNSSTRGRITFEESILSEECIEVL